MVHKGVLTVKAERRPAESRTYLYNGRPHGQFEQNIVLPDTVNGDQIDATLKAGVLQITLTKHAEAKPKKVTVRTA
jgi:HSP20 family protein